MTLPQHALAAELERLERQLLDPAYRRGRTAVAALLSDDFCEFGSSGRIYDKAAVLDLLSNQPASPAAPRVHVQDFAVAHLDRNTALLTYRSTREGQSSLRCSLWLRQRGIWRMRFHQGTPVA